MGRPPAPKTTVDADAIPARLKALKRWGGWKPVWRAGKNGKGRWEKVPLLSTNRPEDWLSFDEAMKLQAEGCGLGLVLTGLDWLIAFDLDRCLDGRGVPQPWAAALLSAVATYWEVTVSGDGLRGFVEGRYSGDWVNKDSVSMEVYSGHGGRFVTVTGDVWPGMPDEVVAVDSEVLADIEAQYRVSGTVGTGAGVGEMPEILDDVSMPDGLNTEAAEFLASGALGEGEDRSATLQWTARCLFEVGLDEAEVLSVLAANEYAMDVALDHRKGDEGRALMYLWQHHVCAAKGKAKVRASGEAFEDCSEPDDGVRGRVRETIARCASMAPEEFAVKAKDEAKALGMTVKELRDFVGEVRARRLRSTGAGREAVEEVVDEINRRFCVAWCGGELNVLREEDGDFLPSDYGSLKRWYANKLVPVPNAEGETELKNPADLWMAAPVRREYKRVEFTPGKSLNGGVLNLWTGWAVEPELGDITPFMELVERVVCAGDPFLIGWVLDWVAHLYQHPARLPSKAVLLQAGQGVGKNTFIDTIKVPLGSAFIQVSSQKHLVGEFNGHLANKLLVHGAESVWGGDKSKVGTLKAMITDEEMAVENKGRDVFQVKNYKRVILSSNENWPIPMDKDDRRFVVCKCAKVWEPSDPFWVEYRKWKAAGGAARVFGALLERDISAFKPWERLPESSSSWDIKLESADALTKFWYAVLSSGDVKEMFKGKLSAGNWRDTANSSSEQGFWPWTFAIPRAAFWETFRDWVRTNSVRHAPEVHRQKDVLKDLCPSMREKQVKALDRTPCFVFQSIEQCRDEFSASMGGKIVFDGLLFEDPPDFTD